MILREELIEMGSYAKPHGVNGEITATLDCDVELLQQFSCLISEIDGIFVPFFLQSVRPKGANGTLLSIDGIESDEAVRFLANKLIYVLRKEYNQVSDEEDCDARPLDYFVGATIISSGEYVGKIVDIDDATSNLLFVVETVSGDESLIPIVDEWIIGYDPEANELEMDIPKELLEL